MRTSPVVLLFAVASLPAASAQRAHAPATVGPAHDTALPVTHVSLYKNGVGFIEHAGTVTGNAAVTLSFTGAQLNDVLQSLSAIDLNGGRISGADYNSTTPLDQQLQSLPLGLPAETTSTGLFTALRGTRVEVRGAQGTGAAFVGRLVDIEMHQTDAGSPASGGTANGSPVASRFITVASDTGDVRIFALSPALSVRLLDTAAHTDLTQYLRLIDSNRNQGFRRLTIDDNGAGTRQLHVSYLSEVPIWKSTYRILLTDAGASPAAQTAAQTATQTATLQGWSVVDNTTGTDWVNVKLSLIAGAPQSFIQPLSQPIYARRPEIPVAQQAQLTPQTHDSSLGSASEQVEVNAAGQAMALEARSMGVNGRGSAILGGLGSGPAPGYEASAKSMILHAGPPAISYEDAAAASLASHVTTAGFDDFFAYNLSEPVTLHTNESALVPILQAKVPVEPITLVSYANGSTTQPLRALWLTNTSGLTLDRGSFTLIEDGSFAGEGLLDPIHPDEKRLLSYAADQAVQVAVQDDKSTSRTTSVQGAQGVLTVHNAETHEVTLVLHNAAAGRRTVVSEVPVADGWQLVSLTDPASDDPKPVETTATVYRFRSEIAPGATKKLHIESVRKGYSTYSLTGSGDDQFQFLLSATHNNPALEAALQPILDARRQVADAQTAVNQTTARLNDLHSDEERQRANITALEHADKSSRKRFVHDLNATEDAISGAQAELAARTATLAAAQASLSGRIEAFHLDETL